MKTELTLLEVPGLPELIDLPSRLGRWFIEPHLVVEGKATPIPRQVSDPEDRVNISRWPLEENYRQEVFRPALASHYLHGGCWDAENTFELKVVEEVADEVVASLLEAVEDLESLGEEDFAEDCGQEALEVALLVKKHFPKRDLGWNFSYEVCNGDLNLNLWVGDCSMETTTKGNPERAAFTKDELFDFSSGDLERLDEGELPDHLTEEDLAPRVLAYVLGVYLRKELKTELGDLYWEGKKTQALMTFLFSAREDQLEDLCFGQLEGSAVSNLWLKTVTDLVPAS